MTEKKHEDPERVYKLEEYQKTILDLALGKREPKNEYERTIAKQIAEGEAKGWMLDLPFD